MHRPDVQPLRRLLLRLAALGLLPVSLLGAWGVWSTVQSQRLDQQRTTLELSRALATAVELEIDATLRSLAVTARSPLLRDGDLRGFHEMVRQEAEAHPEWVALILADAQGRLLLHSALPYGNHDVRATEPASLAQAIESGLPVVGSLSVGPRGLAAFPVRWPVRVDGKVAYVLTAAVKPDRIMELVHKQRVPQSWVLSVFDGQGLRVARSKDHEKFLGGRASPMLRQMMASSPEEGVGLTRTLEGDEVYSGYTRLPSHGWTVAVGMPTAQTQATLWRNLGLYLLGILASVGIWLVLARRLAARIAHDIGAVRDKAVQLGEGRPVAVEHSGIEEVVDMAQALHSASERLGETTRSLREALSGANAAGQAKDEFLAILGHELRNPLAPMLTALHLMDVKAAEDGSTLRERQIMRRQLEHMRRLVDDLLDISRITRGKLDIRSQPVDLCAVVERSVEAVQPATGLRLPGVEVSLPGTPVWVQGDDTRLVQAVSNLLINAMRFGGLAPVTVAVSLEGESVRITVRDHGTGMQPDILAQVFEPFYQAPQGAERSTGGLGLGLAIVRTVVQLHGGTVMADSAGLGLGSRFDIVLPTIGAPGQPQHPAPAPQPARTGRILVVDDNIDALATLTDLLKEAGHAVESLTHPNEVLACVPVFWPDVTVLDIGLPEMNGYQLAQALRDTGWRGPLIALSGYGQAADKTRAQEAGFVRHFTKPADPDALLEAVQSLLREGPQ